MEVRYPLGPLFNKFIHILGMLAGTPSLDLKFDLKGQIQVQIERKGKLSFGSRANVYL